MASAPISQQPRVFYCYSSTTRNGEKKENNITFEARDQGSNETKYIMQGIKPDKSQIASTTLRRELPPQNTCLQTFISPITPGNPDIDSITGRPLTHRLSSGLVVTEVPVTGYWRPRKFEFKGRKYVWLKEGSQTRLYEYSSLRTVEKRKSTVTEFETVKPAIASKTMPFWAGLFMSRYLEVRVAEGVEEALLEVILAGALTESMVTLHGH
ncbi:hypothetical protein IFM58399_05028 [Aspergillus lentulus]|uniref:Uncharacterized protein n=1 Tax=Aspergillus lentulus TaxID=293939 RepID=A0ABQ1ADR7_ASPLE|nr:uncharacterized protein IFM58399_05028 [Aspergillus lentulus]GFF37827.1 hypothetical protein IFM58399_05028 [Aspergillus lentulus]GFF57691.1 hypothetical protein IFM62136_03529 [Aspergillus lentulus]GFF79708.1 hypothetical protein IFM60648_05541 [Aspergillus lentulus]